jgi:NAD(P)H-dependent flavin oxidoreductase YrpB (nitropropane dioxygenase family)
VTSDRLARRLGVAHPVVQAPMAGGIAGAELAAAVSAAGGLGCVGMLDPSALARELRTARRLAGGRPVGAGLLVPFVRRGHVDACIAAGATAVMLFAGHSRAVAARLKAAGIVVLHQVGSPASAVRALHDRADVLVAQGVEAGGHVEGRVPARDALRQILAVAGDAPVLLAGGVATAGDAREAVDAGAAGVVAGTRFLLTPQARAHPAYKAAVLSADATLLTSLFGVGWPMSHRVVANAATNRWCATRVQGPPPVVGLAAASGVLGRVLSQRVALTIARRQRVGIPLYLPLAPLEAHDPALIDVMPLYAGETARRIDALRDAGAVVGELAAGMRVGTS